MRHALIFYYLFSISFSITLSAHFVFLSCCLQFVPFCFVRPFAVGGGRQSRQSARLGLPSLCAELSALRLERFGMCHTGGQFDAYALLLCCKDEVVYIGNAVLVVLLKVSQIIIHYYCFEYCLLLLT